MKDHVCIDEYGLLGINYYWNRRKIYGVGEDELKKVGIINDRVRVHREIIEPLLSIDKVFIKQGYRLFVKEGYRPEELYKLIYKKRVEKFGKEGTDKLINMDKMPHKTGKTADVTLWDPKKKKEIYLRDKGDGINALFVDFYKDRTDEKGKWYQSMQEYVINTMQDNGFRLGVLREYFHFDYNPSAPKNY